MVIRAARLHFVFAVAMLITIMVNLTVPSPPLESSKRLRSQHRRPTPPVPPVLLFTRAQPDELVWKNVKHDTVGRSATTGPDDFTTKIITALERLTRLPNLIRAFFRDPNLRYITV